MNEFRVEFCDPQEYDDAGFLCIYLIEGSVETTLLDVDALHSISMGDVVRLLKSLQPLLNVKYVGPEDE